MKKYLGYLVICIVCGLLTGIVADNTSGANFHVALGGLGALCGFGAIWALCGFADTQEAE